MIALTPPWVNFRSACVEKISSNRTLLLMSDFSCVLCSVICTNRTIEQQPVQIFLQIEKIDPSPRSAFLAGGIVLQNNSNIDLLKGSTCYLEPGDKLWIFSDTSDSLFDATVSFRELREITTI